MADRLGELNVAGNYSPSSSSSGANNEGKGQKDGHQSEAVNTAFADVTYMDEETQVEDQNETQAILEAFNVETEALKQAISRIDKNVETVHQKYKESLHRHVTQTERTEASAQISAVVAQTSKTAQAVRKRLSRIADENEEFARNYPNNNSALRIRVSTHQAITQDFMAAMQRLEDAQERYHEAVRAGVERQLREFNPHASDSDIHMALKRAESSHQAVDDSPLLCELPTEEQRQLRMQLDFLNSRNNDIRGIEQNMVELHQMFMDMQLLVERQGDLLNTIEYNVEETKGKAEAGMNELIQAHDFQRKASRKKWCIAFLIIVILTAISVPLVVKYILKAQKDTSADGVGEAVPTEIPPDNGGSQSNPSVPSTEARNVAQHGLTVQMRPVSALNIWPIRSRSRRRRGGKQLNVSYNPWNWWNQPGDF